MTKPESMNNLLIDARQNLHSARSVAILTGAGISAESGMCGRCRLVVEKQLNHRQLMVLNSPERGLIDVTTPIVLLRVRCRHPRVLG